MMMMMMIIIVMTRWRDNGNNYNAQTAKKATVYKFTIQDRAGNIFFAINSTPIPWGLVCWAPRSL